MGRSADNPLKDAFASLGRVTVLFLDTVRSIFAKRFRGRDLSGATPLHRRQVPVGRPAHRRVHRHGDVRPVLYPVSQGEDGQCRDVGGHRGHGPRARRGVDEPDDRRPRRRGDGRPARHDESDRADRCPPHSGHQPGGLPRGAEAAGHAHLAAAAHRRGHRHQHRFRDARGGVPAWARSRFPVEQHGVLHGLRWTSGWG